MGAVREIVEETLERGNGLAVGVLAVDDQAAGLLERRVGAEPTSGKELQLPRPRRPRLVRLLQRGLGHSFPIEGVFAQRALREIGFVGGERIEGVGEAAR